MKRVLRDVVVSAVSAVATVGVGSGALLASSEALAQDSGATATPQTQPGVAIRRVVVEGNQRIEPATIASYLLVRPGDTFDPERIDLSLKTLFATGLFADVNITQRDGDLVVSLKTRSSTA
jgi:outer membrane protein insertion porin family